MAAMLALVQQTSVEMGLSSPATVAGNSTQDVVQTLALMNAVGYEVQRQYQWQAMTVDFKKSLNKFKVPPKEQSELIAIVESTKGDIVLSAK